MSISSISIAPPVRRSDQLLQIAERCDRAYVVGHNNPDPDAISSGWAISHLISERLGKPASLVAGGEIVRAENRKMVRLLHPPLRLTQDISADPRSLVVLVDCDLKALNHIKVDAGVQPVAVIDHHVEVERRDDSECVFSDLRPEVASTAAIAASYLHEQGMTPPMDLATALVYGIRTETSGGESHYSALDRQMLVWLTGLADPSVLSEIADATLAVPYFADMAIAFQSTTLYDDAAFCALPQCQGPESVGEIADLLLRCEGVKHVFCGALFRGDLIASVRTEGECNAAREVILLLAGLGKGGGHPHRAGGIIKGVGDDAHGIFDELRRRWRKICSVEEASGVPLVQRRSRAQPTSET